MKKVVLYTSPHIVALPFEISWGYGAYSVCFLIWHLILYTDYENMVEKQIAEVKRQVEKIKAKRKEVK